MIKLLLQISFLFVVLNTFIQCTESSKTLAGGASETEASIQVSVINLDGQAAPKAKLWIHDRVLVSEAIDSTVCDNQGICSFNSIQPGSYLIRSEFEQSMSMVELNITHSGDSVPTAFLQLAPPSQIKIESYQINHDDSIIRIGIAGFNRWDTIQVDQAWTSPSIPIGNHIIIIESSLESIQLTTQVNDTITLLSTTTEIESPPVHYILDDFYDRGDQTDWSIANNLIDETWQFQGEISINGGSDAYTKSATNSPHTFYNFLSLPVNWGNIQEYFVRLDTTMAGGIITPVNLDSALLPTVEPYLDLVTSFYTTQSQPFTHLDSVSLILYTDGTDDFQVIAFDSNQEVINRSNRVGTSKGWQWTTLHFSQINSQIRQLGFRNFGESTGMGYIVIHGR